MKQKHVAILFSAGMDSTYLIYKAIKDPKVSKISTLYSHIKNNQAKTKVETQQRKTILELLKKHDHTGKLNGNQDKNIFIDLETPIGDISFYQLPTFLTTLFYYCSSDIDEFWIGYVNQDTSIPYINDIKKLYNAYKPFTHNQKLPKLEFPIAKMQKSEIKDILPSEIFQETITCENPNILNESEKVEFENCGNCQTCQRDHFLGIFRKKYDSKKMIDPHEKEISKSMEMLQQTSHFVDQEIEIQDEESVDLEKKATEATESEKPLNITFS